MILPILRYPDTRLRTIAKKVTQLDDDTRTLIRDLFETMYSEDGIGLAATQVNQHLQIVVLDVPDSADDYQILLDNRVQKVQKTRQPSQPLCLINPVITHKEGSEIHAEGCLSVPDFRADVERASQITLSAFNENFEPLTMNAQHLLAVCIQHELDHLNGVLFVDYLSKLKQKRLREKLKKSIKINA